MSTYAALLNLLRTLEDQINPGGDLIFDRVLLQSIHKKVSSLLDSLENETSSSAVDERNTRLREAVYQAEDAIESQVLESRIMGYDRTTSKLLYVTSFYLFLPSIPCIIVTLCYHFINPERMLDWIKIFLVTAGVLYSWRYTRLSRLLYRYIRQFVFTREQASLLAIDQNLSLVTDNLNLIEETQTEEEGSAYAALISLRRTLVSVLSLDGYYNRAQLESLHKKVSFLLGTCLKVQESKLDATIRDAAYKARSLIKFRIPAELDLISARIRSSRTLDFRIKFFVMLISFLIHSTLHFFFLPYLSFLSPGSFPKLQLVYYFLRVGLSGPVLVVLTIYNLIYVAYVYRWSRVNSSVDIVKKESNESLRLVIGDLEECVNKVKDACGNPSSEQSSSSPRRELGNSNVVVGLERDILQIKTHLLGDPSSQREVISIVGMGGIGKTTLATLAYNDSDIRCHFDLQAWVSVSQEYTLRRVLLRILDSANLLTKGMQEKEDDEKLGLHLYQSLVGRRYLIVMDDVWDTEIWDSITIYLPENKNGSRILLTSRLTDIASYPKSSIPLHQMQCLNEDKSWRLLCEKVFIQHDCPFELESIGKEIAKNCQGLPLAIVVIGGLLHKKNQLQTRREVARNLKSNLQAELSDILGLSYKHLPHHLRPCFLHMGALPCDSEIPVSKLISFWVAEGFLRPQTSKSLEETAEEYLNDLNDRNLILVGKRSYNGKIRTCSIHDLLRDVCVQNSQKENFLHDVDSSNRIIFHFPCVHPLPYKFIFFRYLRVLDIAVMELCEFPDDITRLIHLRYLAFYSNGPIPPSISKLWNLQTFIIVHIQRRIPYSLW